MRARPTENCSAVSARAKRIPILDPAAKPTPEQQPIDEKIDGDGDQQTAQILRRLRFSIDTIRRYLDQKRLEGIKIGEGEIRISGSSVVKMIEEGKTRYTREGNQVGYALTKKGTSAKSKDRAKKVLEQVGPVDAVKARAATVLERLGLKT